jgi:hypothetical protein
MLRSGLPMARRANGSLRGLSPQALLIGAILLVGLLIFVMSPSSFRHIHDDDDDVSTRGHLRGEAPKPLVPTNNKNTNRNVYSLTAKDIDDVDVHLSKFIGKVQDDDYTPLLPSPKPRRVPNFSTTTNRCRWW